MTAATAAKEHESDESIQGPGDEGMVMPERRDLHFLPPKERIHDWHAQGPHMTQFMNALSLFFPAGERLFIDALRAYRDQIPDPDLKKAATAFIGQEAMHSREHIEYNKLMQEEGLPADKLDAFVWSLLDFLKERTPKSMPLNATIALEHFTALMGGFLLDHPEVMEGSQDDYLRMWQWHAMEEVEHKAVCYDVWEKCIGRGPTAYLKRAFGMTTATVIFWPLVVGFYFQMVNNSEACRKEGWRGHLTVLNTLLGKPGVLRRQIPEWLEYFKYSFHPWQQNNSHHIAHLNELAEEAEEAYQKAMAGEGHHHHTRH
ncbi:metal-dependent hydrolase [Halospina sp. K52047b]|uniref:metal-dependent hydrolase n=1 Tax=Halospina sp. K52047b TaxID=2614160 RepID=UPI001CE45263|nr:metal-dependent hydrolase [Halospina sp. K52047b]